MTRVRIGITTSFNDGEQRLNHDYVRAVEKAGGLPLIVPMLEDDDVTAAFAELLDGLIITGGPAIRDGLVGDLPDDIDDTAAERTKSDKRILEAFLKSRKPILGICYGMQMVNARFGGTIYADVQHQVENTINHSKKRGADMHPMSIARGTVLHDVLGTDEIDINTRHVQALASVGTGFRVSATAPDGVIEAIENEDGTILGVQYHPENLPDTMGPLFRHLVEQAEARRGAQGQK